MSAILDAINEFDAAWPKDEGSPSCRAAVQVAVVSLVGLKEVAADMGKSVEEMTVTELVGALRSSLGQDVGGRWA